MVSVINGVNDRDKIDSYAVDGLGGVSNSLAYRLEEIEKHHHSQERWFGKSADQSGNDWGVEGGLTSYQAISGSGDYGGDADDEAKILGTDDTPVSSGYAYFDMHHMLIVDVSQATPYILRVVWGTGTMADAITAGQYSTVAVEADPTNPQQSSGLPMPVMMPRVAAGSKLWIQAQNATDNATIDFLIGIHEYRG